MGIKNHLTNKNGIRGSILDAALDVSNPKTLYEMVRPTATSTGLAINANNKYFLNI